MRRFLAATLLLTVVAAVFSGCGRNTDHERFDSTHHYSNVGELEKGQ